MKHFITVRIYFEYGQKTKGLSFWKKLYSSDFSTELMKRAKAFGLHQVLHLNVSKGYLNGQKINWGTNEIRHYKHPHLIEIIDVEEKILTFLNKEDLLLKDTKVIVVKDTILIRQ